MTFLCGVGLLAWAVFRNRRKKRVDSVSPVAPCKSSQEMKEVFVGSGEDDPNDEETQAKDDADGEAATATDNPDGSQEASSEPHRVDEAEEGLAPARRPILHGRHWAVLAGEPEPQRFLVRIFEQLLKSDGATRATGEGRLWHLVDNCGRLQLSALVRKSHMLEVLAIYPYAETENRWPVHIERIDRSPDGLQARLFGESGGAHFAVFDTLYFKNQQHYAVGETYDLQVSAIAYQLESDQIAEERGPQHGFGSLPVLSDDRDATDDEIVFHSTIEDVFETDFWGIELQVYRITLLDTPKGPLRVEIYAHPALAERRFSVGDRVRGVAWLFGLWPDPQATALAEALKANHLPN